MSRAAYNEIDPKAAAWLRELIKQGLIAPGDVIEASIEDLTPNDLKPYTQVHFFAGIGVWSHALRRAGWPDDRPVWTGSCPCQPFSAAGKGGGFDDERHLWPAFHYLIDQCRPDVVFGEQVASKDGLGWLDLVQADLEGTGYASGAVDLCAAGVGAPHIRQRLWWFGERLEHAASDGRLERRAEPSGRSLASGRSNGGLELPGNDGLQGRPDQERGVVDGSAGRDGSAIGMANGSEQRRIGRGSGEEGIEPGEVKRPDGLRDAGGMADPSVSRRDEEGQHERGSSQLPTRSAEHGGVVRPTGPTNDIWGSADWLHCRDHKWRPVEPGTFPLAHGAPARVGRLRGYGNAIVAPAAQAFIEAYLETQAPDDRCFRLTEVSHLSLEGVFA